MFKKGLQQQHTLWETLDEVGCWIWVVPISLIQGCDLSVIKYNQMGAESLSHHNTGTGFPVGLLLWTGQLSGGLSG